MHPRDISIVDFQYPLPADRIARYPLAERDSSKLLVHHAGSGSYRSSTYRQLSHELPKGTLLVFNNTKVVEARLYFRKPTGGMIEIFCLEPHDQYADITTAMLQKQQVWWKCLVGGAKKWKEGPLDLSFTWEGKQVLLQAEKISQENDHFIISFRWEEDLAFADVLHAAGQLPIPPYLERETEEDDHERYQTVFAQHDGSVAAPTAGLHFTDRLLLELQEAGIEKGFVTLHVGAGTFKPVKAATMAEHDMHAEFIDVPVSAIQQIKEALEQGVVPVGTTSLRTVESLYWLGKKIMLHPSFSRQDLFVAQWDPYEQENENPPADTALTALINWLQAQGFDRLLCKTQIIIAPGYRFRIAKGLITNFHQPQSTLLLLVAAMIGKEWRALYQHALDNDYRFLSYGDGCLLWR
jgi:S-adenosylmethionine:tRNA ribosyltransferase-isomerase